VTSTPRISQVGARGLLAFCAAAGLPVEPFQRKIARAAFGPERELVVLLPRGNGKSRLAGALAVHHLLTVPRPAVYVAAASRDQARVVFEYARDLATHDAVAQQVTVRHLELRACGGYLRVLASDAALLHGLTPSLAIVDELHAFRDAAVYLALRTAMLKRPDARMLTISTAAQGAGSPLGRLRQRALAQPQVRRRGALTDARGPALRMLEWAVPDEASIADMRRVKQANPASWLTPDALREQREAVPELAFRRFHCGQWTAREGAWLPPGAWQACAGEVRFEPGEPVWVGVDVGGERSKSAVVWVTADLRVGCQVYEGDEGVLRCAERVRDLARELAVMEIAFDPWRFTQAALEFEREGLPAVAFPQTDARMIPASQRLYDAVLEGRLTHPDDAELNQHAACAVARHSRRGWRLDKTERSDAIDALVALCMAVERAEQRPEPARLVGWL
jgi:phage terminase large subunit-like protein